ncbi:MAG: hypothetical protein K2L72_04050, partial [Clostridia bacterium]|nr:hypothetical protein [Clostridia bacterium]
MWGEGEVTQPASCTEYGETTYTCNLCGQSKTEAIPMTNHDFTGDWTETEGGHTRKCAECGTADTVSVVPHAFTEDADKRVPSTCHSDGVRTMVCSDCGAVTTEAITERPEHSLGDWQAAEGGHRKVCSVDGCGYVGETELHNMKDGEIIKEPTATEKGEKKSICSDCGYTEIIEIPTTDHIASEEYGKDNDYHWNICGAHADCGERVNQTPHDYKELTHLREEPTCGKDGKSFWECVCGATKEEVVSKNTVPHDFDNAEYADEGDGGHHLICNVCGAAGESVEHTYGEGEITTEPTFWEEGVKTSKCVCGHVAEEAVARKNSTSADVNDQDWKFGVVNYHFPDETDSREYFTFNQITDENGDGDGYSKDGTEIKNNWFCGANFDTFICMAYTFKEDVDSEITVPF